MKTLKSLFAAAAAVFLSFGASAVTTAKVVIEDSGKTLRFVFDDKVYSEWIPADFGEYGWTWSDYNSATRVIIDPTFRNCRSTSFSQWFCDFDQIEVFEGLENLDTSEATDFSYMFNGCVSLLELDVSGFDTSKAENMENMFGYCSNLKKLNLASFDTEKVTNMAFMFVDCSSLETIGVSGGFVTDAVTESLKMFSDCTALVGGNGTKYADANPKDITYARIDKPGVPGYFTEPVLPLAARAVVRDNGKTLLFVYNTVFYGVKGKDWFSVAEAEAIDPYDNPVPWNLAWNAPYTKVVFDASFRNYRPKSCGGWFDSFRQMAAIEGLENLDTSEATSMAWMFYDCYALTELDLSSFDTAKVTDMMGMFEWCESLETISVSDTFVTAQVSDSDEMFCGCCDLVGGNGTAWSDTKPDDKTYARIDTAFNRGYFTGDGTFGVNVPTGRYCAFDLEDDLGIVIDANEAVGDKVTVKIETLPKGLKLAQDKTTRAWILSGVPTEEVDCSTQTMYARVTVTYKDKSKGKSETLQPLPLTVYSSSSGIFDAAFLGQDYETSVKSIWPEADANWTIKGWPAGLKYTAKDIAAKGKEPKHGAFTVYGKPTKAGEFTITASHKVTVGKTSYTETETATMIVWGDDGKASCRYAHLAYAGEIDPIVLADAKSVGGLPTGLKFKNGVVTGMPTKGGTYAVTVTKNDKSKETFLWSIGEGENFGVTSDIDWVRRRRFVTYEQATVSVMQGLYYSWYVPVPEGAKVTITGLPTGLKLVDYTKYDDGWFIEGVPTKVENKVAVFKTVRNGVTVTERVAFSVLPNEFAGTCYLVQDSNEDYGEYTKASVSASVSIAAGGTVKLILAENTRKTTVTAKYLEDDDGAVGVSFVLPKDAKAGIPERPCSINLEEKQLWIGNEDDLEYVGSLKGTVVSEMPEDMVVPMSIGYLDVDGGKVFESYLYLTATVNKKTGVVGVTGKLSDGTAIKATTYCLSDETFVGMAPILVTDKKKCTLSITLVFNGKKNRFDAAVRMDGAMNTENETAAGMWSASVLKNKKLSDLMSEGGALTLSSNTYGMSETFDLTAKQVATKLGTGGLVKLTQKDDDGWTWTVEMVPVVDNADQTYFRGFATGKKGKETRVVSATTFLPE